MDELLQTGFAVADKDRLYRCLDRLLEHKQELFQHLRQRWQDLFNTQFDVLLYDVVQISAGPDPHLLIEDLAVILQLLHCTMRGRIRVQRDREWIAVLP